MKLDRNRAPDGTGKYALVKLRALHGLDAAHQAQAQAALDALEALGLLDRGPVGSESEFFVLRLRDRFALPALVSYGRAALLRSTDMPDLKEYANDVLALAERAGVHSPFCKIPD